MLRRAKLSTSAVLLGLSILAAPATARSDGLIRTTSDALQKSAAIVEGTVSGAAYDYDDQDGPRTVITIIDLVTHLGDLNAEQVELRTLGGPVPDGRFLRVSETARFTVGTRYLVFLRANDWFYSPVLTQHAFRLERDEGRGDDVLLSQEGAVVIDVTPDVLTFSPAGAVEIRLDLMSPFLESPLRTGGLPAIRKGVLKKRFLEVLEDAGVVPTGQTFDPWPAARRPGSKWSEAQADPDILEQPEDDSDLMCSPAEELTCEPEGEAGE